MKITKTSPLTGQVHTIDISITMTELEKWMAGAPIQVAMPHLSEAEREFILTGIPDHEWVAAFREDDPFDGFEPIAIVIFR